VAKLLLAQDSIEIFAHTIRIGSVKARKFRREEIELNPVRCADPKAAVTMVKAVIEAQKAGDSLGGIVEVIAAGVPAGLGDPVFAKLDAELAYGIMSIGAVKGIEFGAGFKAAEMRGSEMNDPIYIKNGRISMPSNRSGGILGGISTGEDIVMRLAVKPTPSISLLQRTVDNLGRRKTLKITGRHDPCICPRIVPVAEAMTAIVLADHTLRWKAIRNR
jgi:chorismate synthase